MRVLRFFAVMLIFGCVSVAWVILGGSMWVRTHAQDEAASKEMQDQWGPKVLRQTAPYWIPSAEGKTPQAGSVSPSASKIAADISHEHRYKGLLWFSTFEVTFAGEYTIPADPAQPQPGADKAAGQFLFRLPEGITTHDGLRVAVDGEQVEIPTDQKASGRLEVPVGREAEHVVSVTFKTCGQDVWLYSAGEKAQTHDHWRESAVEPNSAAMSELKNFSLTVTTDFADIDYPKGTRSPTNRAAPSGPGMLAGWEYDSLVTSQAMGIAMPKRDNAGPIAARMAFFAPVSLFFFFAVLVAVVLLKNISLHPMHYLFISAGFFAFHILMAYLADIMNIHRAFWICAGVSVFLVVSYMRLVAGVKFAATYVALAQLAYLVGFSYAFLWKGRTGLTVTIGAILTLFVLMQATGRVKWGQILTKPAPPAPPTPPTV